MKLITRDLLRKKMDQGDDFKLVFVLGEWHYRAKHIPGSIHISEPEKIKEHLKHNDNIVVYCADVTCPASRLAYKILREEGFKNVRRYAGGIADWEEAGYPLEGEMVN